MCFHKSFFPSQALCPSYRGLSPSSRQDTRASVRELSWRWSASFTPPGVSKNMTSVTAAGWKTAAYGFLSATPGSAVEASPKQECAHLDSLTRRSIFTAPTAIGSPKFLNKRKQIHFFYIGVTTELWVQASRPTAYTASSTRNYSYRQLLTVKI